MNAIENSWFNAITTPPKYSGHYEIIDSKGRLAFDDYSVDKKIWWNSNVAKWRYIRNGVSGK